MKGELLLVASCCGNRDKLRPDGPLGSYAYFTFSHVVFCTKSRVLMMQNVNTGVSKDTPTAISKTKQKTEFYFVVKSCYFLLHTQPLVQVERQVPLLVAHPFQQPSRLVAVFQHHLPRYLLKVKLLMAIQREIQISVMEERRI